VKDLGSFARTYRGRIAAVVIVSCFLAVGGWVFAQDKPPAPAPAVVDWTEKLRTALRLEYMKDAAGVRTQLSLPGNKLDLWEVTMTAQYKVWKGLVARVEYRHDSANQKTFSIRAPGYVPTGKTQDTISFDLYYLFF